MAAISTLTETWDSIDALKWNNWGGAPYVTVSGGELVLVNNPPTTNYYGIETQATYDWTGDYCMIELGTMPTLDNTNDPEYAVTPMSAEIDVDNRYYWGFEGNNELVAFKVVGGTYQWQNAVAFNAAVHKYLRIREASGTMYWEYSTDGTSWTAFADEVTTGVAVTALRLNIAHGQWAAVAGTYTARIKSVNVAPAASNNGNGFFSILGMN